MTFPLRILLLTWLSFSLPLSAEEVNYLRDIKPLLMQKCSSCHGPLKQEGEVRLDAVKFILQRADLHPLVIKGEPEQSLILQRVTASDIAERMPPAGEGEALNSKEIQLLTNWIRLGLPAPDDEEVLSSPAEHWAYQPLQRPSLPMREDAPESVNPIDLLLSHQQRKQRLIPVSRATPEALLRRLTFDVTGLPPTLSQLQEFTSNPTSTEYEKLVEQLLNSPHYGERWGRHWMDVWRYSDWSGYKQELRESQRHIWHWRDWIIESLNKDKSYDRMIVEMLAADEVAPLDQDSLRATGFLARNFHASNRNIWLDSTVEHTAKAFLGMTINCSRCHDHKFDPISQQEYYTFRAIFEPHNVRTDRLPGVLDTTKDGLARAFDKEPNAQTFLYLRGDDKHPDKDHPLAAQVVEILGVPFEVQPVKLPVQAFFPALNPRIEQEEKQRLEQELATAQTTLAKFGIESESANVSIENQASRFPPAPARPMTLDEGHQAALLKFEFVQAKAASLHARYAADRQKYQPDASLSQSYAAQLAQQAAFAERRAQWLSAVFSIFQKWLAVAQAQGSSEKDAAKKTAAIEKAEKELAGARTEELKKRGELTIKDGKYPAVGPIYPQESTGRRSALAKWIVHSQNPLTARVAVNQIWMRHFGTPLVENVFDFGMRSPRPVHAELLDWLAVEFIESGWSMKHVHRLILTSKTYQQSSAATGESLTQNQLRDKDNRYYWKFNVTRLESEMIRDSILSVSGMLDLSMSGPDVDFAKGEEVLRRSVYFNHAYEKQMLMMTIFDAANPTDCYRRSPSIIPQQALALSNSQLSISAARRLAGNLSQSHPEVSPFIRRSFLQVLGREPQAEELSACEQFLASQTTLLSRQAELNSVVSKVKASVEPSKDAALRARENLIHVLMNHNDFVSVR